MENRTNLEESLGKERKSESEPGPEDKRSKRGALRKTEKEGGLWQLESLLSMNALCDQRKDLPANCLCHCNMQCR